MRHKNFSTTTFHSAGLSLLALFMVLFASNVALAQPCNTPPPVNLIQNPGFETNTCGQPIVVPIINGAINNCVPNWASANGSPSLCTTTNANQGIYTACLGADGLPNNCVRNEAMFQNVTLCANTNYLLSFLHQAGLDETGTITAFLASGLVNQVFNQNNEGTPCLTLAQNWQLIRTVNAPANVLIQENIQFSVGNNVLNQLGFMINDITDEGFTSTFDNISLVIAPFTPNITILNGGICSNTVSFQGSIPANLPPSFNNNTWTWVFGDGTTGSGQTVQHVYQTPGVYTVCLTVTNACGQIVGSQSQTVDMDNYVNAKVIPMTACRGKIGQAKIELSTVNGINSSAFPSSILMNAQVSITPANLGITVTGIQFNSSGLASNVSVQTDGSATPVMLEMAIPQSVPIGQVITVTVIPTAVVPPNNSASYYICNNPGPFSAQLTVVDCGEFSCPCIGQNALNIVATGSAGRLSTNSNFPPGQLNNTCLSIKGIFHLDKDYTITGGEIRMQPGSLIIVERQANATQPVHININQVNVNGGIHGCDDLWSGIQVRKGEKLDFGGNIISDANTAIQLEDKCEVAIAGNDFDNNKYGIRVQGSSASGYYPVPNAYIESNKFRSTYHILIDGSHALAGVQVRNGALLIGLYDNIGASGNKFNFLPRGIDVSQGFVGIGTALMSDFDAFGFGVFAEQNSIVAMTHSNIFGANEAFRFNGSLLFSYGNVFEHSNLHGLSATVSLAGDISRGNIFADNGQNAFSGSGNGYFKIKDNFFSHQLQNHIIGGGLSAISFNMHNPVNRTFIENNEFHYNPVLMFHSDLISLRSSSNIHMYDNLETHPTQGGKALNLYDANNCRFRNNNISRTDAGNTSAGIYVQFGDDNRFCCNILNNLTGFDFIGTNGSNILRQTNFVNIVGKAIQCASGTVLSQVAHGGNLWNGFPAKHNGSVTQRMQSAFLIQDSDLSASGIQKQPPLWPEQPSDNNFFQYLAGNAPTCAADLNCGTRYFPEFLLTGDEQFEFELAPGDRNIARQVFASDAEGPVLNWEMQRELLLRLKRKPALIGQDMVIDSFYNAVLYSNLDKFTDIENGIKDIANTYPTRRAEVIDRVNVFNTKLNAQRGTDAQLALDPNDPIYRSDRNAAWQSLAAELLPTLVDQEDNKNRIGSKAATLFNQNSAITPRNNIENNLKIVNDVHLRMLKSGLFSIDMALAQVLYPVATQCPMEGGKAVLRARNLYQLYEETDFSAYDDCNLQQRSEVVAAGSLIEADFTINPNPTSGILYVTPKNVVTNAGKDVSMTLFDMTGKAVFTKVLKDNVPAQRIELHEVANGIYFARFSEADGKVSVSKIVITR